MTVRALIAAHGGHLDADWGILSEGRRSGTRRRIPVMMFMLETTDGLIAWDTGMCTDIVADPVRYLGSMARSVMVPHLDHRCSILERIDQAGYSVDDVSCVLNSHLHFDHAGMNQRFRPEVLRYRERELHWGLAADGYVRTEFESAPASQIFDYDDQYEVAPGLTLIDAAGHTPGHQCLRVTFSSGADYVLTGDLVYTLEHLALGQAPGVRADPVQARASIRRIAALDAQPLVCHDPDLWTDDPLQVVHRE